MASSSSALSVAGARLGGGGGLAMGASASPSASSGSSTTPLSLRHKLSPHSPFLPSSLEFIDVLQQDMMGRVVPMRLSTRTFDQFELKNLVLELPLLEVTMAQRRAEALHRYEHAQLQHQMEALMRHQAGQLQNSSISEEEAAAQVLSLREQHQQRVQKQQFTLPDHPIMKGATQNYYVVADFESLVKIHKPTNVYRVLPKKTTKMAAYVTMKEVCGLPNSPFTDSDKVDPHNYKIVLKGEYGDVCRSWTEGTEGRSLNFPVAPGMPIGFDGMLLGKHDAALILCNQILQEKAVTSILGMVGFLRFFVPGCCRRNNVSLDYENIWTDFLKRRRVHFVLSGDRPPSRDALGFAKSKGVHMFTRYGPYYRYCQ